MVRCNVVQHCRFRLSALLFYTTGAALAMMMPWVLAG
jgi:hypothetical protein